MRWMPIALLLLTACSAEPAPAEAAPTEPAAEEDEPPAAHQVHPELYKMRSVHGTVSDAAGAPVKGATITIMRSDTGPEKNPLDADGRYAIHLREENSGPPPWVLVYGAPGHADQTHTLPTMPEEGVQIDIKLVKAAAEAE